MKIDVEGHEKNVITGGRNLIKKCKPNLLIEIEERHSDDKTENIINYVNNLGYKSYEFPINFRQRDFGKSKIPKIEIFRTLYNIFKLYFKKKNL